MALPNVKGGLKGKNRKVYAEIPAEQYVQFELEAKERGVTPYRFASAIIAEYLNGGLVEVEHQDNDTPRSASPSPSPSVAADQ